MFGSERCACKREQGVIHHKREMFQSPNGVERLQFSRRRMTPSSL